MSWENSIKPFLDSNPEVASISVGTKDGTKWCDVGSVSNISSTEIQEYASSGGKCFGAVSYIWLQNVEGCDVFKKGDKSLVAFKGEKIVVVFVLRGPKPEVCLKTTQDVVEYLRETNWT